MLRAFIHNYILNPAIFLIAGFCIGQPSSLEKATKYLDRLELDSALIIIKTINIEDLNEYENGLIAFKKGEILKKMDKHYKAYLAYQEALSIFKRLDSLRHEADTNYEIYDLLVQQNSLKVDPLPYLDKYVKYAHRTGDPLLLARAYSKVAGVHWNNDNFERAKSFFRKSLKQLEIIQDTLRINSIKVNLGSIHISTKNGDSALYYYEQTTPYFQKIDNQYYVSNNYNNQGRAYEILNDTLQAVEYYQCALEIELKQYNSKTTAEYLTNLIRCYQSLKMFPEALQSAQQLIDLNGKIDNLGQNQALIDAEEKYRTSEKERLRLRNQNVAIGLGAILLLGTIIAFLLQKNTKKKQRIAEQQRELEIQKTEKILKEQELTTIDAMIAGQEKERQRLASDLHDSVGATLAAAKLQFDHLSKNKSKLEELDELFNKTEKLLDDAYTEVRSMAHAKNSGVLAKDGLLPAVLKLAKNASGTNQLQIDVQDFGLEERLDNSLEITVFRIIQELVTNIIKHADASEANISITQHEDSLNIMVEDNGIGFKPLEATKTKNGMGLDSIERRVEHLEGSMDIDSSEEKGTTIVIDIPL